MDQRPDRRPRFPDAPVAPENTGGAAQSIDISGARFPGVSKWSLAWGGEANVPAGANGGQFYVGADASYRSSYSSNATPSPYFLVDAYSIANFRAGYRDDSNLNVFAWVKNAFDTQYFEFLSNQPGNNGLVVGQLGDPRTYGVTVAKKF